jgi:hypothetical protein
MEYETARIFKESTIMGSIWRGCAGLGALILLGVLAAGCDVEIGPDDANPLPTMTPSLSIDDAEATWGAEVRSWPALYSLQMLSPTDGWAVGRSNGDGGKNGAIRHWNGKRWEQVPAPANALLRSVHMLSPTEGWAVGDRLKEDGSISGLLVHYTGGRWEEVPSPTDASLYDVYTVSPSEAWAVGLFDILHYQDNAWHSVPISTEVPVYTVAIDMVAPDEGWVLGRAEDGGNDFALHYQAGQWTVTRLEARAGITDIDMLSAAEGWAVGTYGILHYTGGQWQRVKRPLAKPLRSLQMLSPTDGWAVGVNDAFSPPQNLVVRYTGGAWQEVVNPPQTPPPGMFIRPGDVLDEIPGNDVSDLFMLSPTEGWAVARDTNILRYENGVWTVWHPPLE